VTTGRARLCPRCGNLVGSEDDQCYSCGLRLGSPAHGLASLRGFFAKYGNVTVILSSVLLVFFVAMVLLQGGLFAAESGSGLRKLLGGFSGKLLYRCGAEHPFGIQDHGEIWRFVTAMFIHAGLVHFLFNTYVLLQLGRLCEHYFDRRRTFVIFFLSGAVGCVGSFLAGKFSVGASGAILGLAGAILAKARWSGGGIDRMIFSQLLRWVILIVVLGFVLSGVIDWVAHLVGLVVGGAVGWILIREGSHHRRFHAGLFVTCVVLTLVAIGFGIVFCASWPPPAGYFPPLIR
jgi:membrane associated rhomboid family serine protease